ncbi:MAG: hypothetical protein WC726_01025 [Parcubacteria group bacterium]|jgi:hypothetical protein
MKKIILVLFVAAAVTGASLYTVRAKKTSSKKNYKKVYNFSVQGDCTNADVDITAFNIDDQKMHTLFRKISVPSIKTNNMPKMELLKKHVLYSEYPSEIWEPVSFTDYHLIDGNILIEYGDYDSDDPSEGCSDSYNLGDFRLFIY